MPGNFAGFSPRGELDAVAMLALSIQGYKIYNLNHTGMLGLPQHRTNPLDYQKIDSLSLEPDIQKTALDFCPTPPGVKSAWPYDDARRWYGEFSLYDAERSGCATLPGIYELLLIMQSDIDRWCDHLEAMSISRFPSVQAFAGEIMTLQREGKESFTAPLGILLNAFAFMRDPRLQHMLSGNDFSLMDVLSTSEKVGIFIDWPIDYIESQASIIRLIIGTVIQHKFRNPNGAVVSAFIDEAGQLKNLPSLRLAYTFGRGAGLIGNIAAWQEISQINSAFGPEAGEIIGSAQYRVFKGVRTIESARLVSSMCGTMTLEYDATLEQSNAKRLKMLAANQMLRGEDFQKTLADLRHQQFAAQHRTKQAREVLKPDEVLNLPPSVMVAFASGLVEGPIMGHWIPYFQRRDFAGKYLNNPYHGERVSVQSFWGSRKLEIIEEEVPARLGHLPQYQNGTWRYVEGYRPKV